MTTSDPDTQFCACPCAAQLAQRGPSATFHSEHCQRRWYLHRLGLPVPAALQPGCAGQNHGGPVGGRHARKRLLNAEAAPGI